MTICKWRTSSPELTATIPEALREAESDTSSLAPNLCRKTLGIHWDTTSDSFHISTPSVPSVAQPTKRELLSAIARVYDILGWYAPAVLTAKLIMQETWKLGLTWEDPLPDNLHEQMDLWCSQLHLLTKHPISRYYHCKERTLQATELHGFADASAKGYGGVIYVRSMYTNHTISVSLIMSRGKVVPVKKPPSIPRLELCAAVMTARMMAYVSSILDIDLGHSYCWSDSSAVIGWIHLPPDKLETYVGNRVRKIADYTSPYIWRYVNTADNPADCLSRGVLPKMLVTHDLWWHSPAWLQLDTQQWPKRPDINLSRELPVETAEVLRITITHLEMGLRMSSFSQLLRVFAWMWRFIQHTRGQSVSIFSSSMSLSPQELRQSRLRVLRSSQQAFYSTERALLQTQKPLPHHLSLSALAPFIDSNGLLRVGGRIQKAGLPYDTTHPIILCHRSHTTLLLLREIHFQSSHAGPQAMMAILSQTYYVTGVKQVVRRISRNCVACREVNSTVSQQLMGNLPDGRVTPTRAFSNVGLDYAGPFHVKTGSVRRPILNKAYICVFVCFSTRAVHLEVVSDLSTEAFLAALSRFVGRRGHPTTIHSDNGSNFVGAANEIASIKAMLQDSATQNAITRWALPRTIVWHFNPARAPHFGGLWEAAVGCMKKSLRKVMGEVILNFEQLSTVVIQVEAMLNSRPLIPVDSLPDEATPLLTAGHFLIGAPLSSMPSLVDSDSAISLIRRWNLTQRLTYDIWNRWSNEYLLLLQRRSKWRYAKRQIRVGDLVLVRGEGTFNRQWPKGRVCKVYPGPDGFIRAVDVQTSGGVFRRPIAKLCVIIEALEDEPSTGEYVRAKDSLHDQNDVHAESPGASATTTTLPPELPDSAC